MKILLIFLLLASCSTNKDIYNNYCYVAGKPVLPQRIKVVSDSGQHFYCLSSKDNVSETEILTDNNCIGKELEDHLYHQAEKWVRLCKN